MGGRPDRDPVGTRAQFRRTQQGPSRGPSRGVLGSAYTREPSTGHRTPMRARIWNGYSLMAVFCGFSPISAGRDAVLTSASNTRTRMPSRLAVVRRSASRSFSGSEM